MQQVNIRGLGRPRRGWKLMFTCALWLQRYCLACVCACVQSELHNQRNAAKLLLL